MPTCRGGNFVNFRIKELENSTYKNIELIIIEDGIVEPYNISNNIPTKIIKLEKNSQSVSIPRAIGISFANGEFISHADDDVVIFHDKFENLLNFIENSYYVYGDRVEIILPGSNKSSPYSNDIQYKHISQPNWDIKNVPGIDGGQFIYKTIVWEYNKFIFPKRACDWETSKLVLQVKDEIKYAPKIVSGYIWHNSNRHFDLGSITREIKPEDYTKYFNQENLNI